MRHMIRAASIGVVFTAFVAALGAQAMLNVSYDSTREFYQAYNVAFAKYWKAKTGKDVTVTQNHAASGVQSRAVVKGLDADVVTLALAPDVDAIAAAGLTAVDWQMRLPDRASPYYSTVVFLVRKGNPKGIKDWNDLARSGVRVITPNPKTSGGGRWNYLAAWIYAVKQPGGTDGKARGFLGALLRNAPDLDVSARAAMATFQRGTGDVLIASESDAFQAMDAAKDKFEIVAPSMTVVEEPAVAVVDAVVAKKGTKDVAEAYLQYLYSPEAQEIAAKFHLRPRDPDIRAKHELALVTTMLLFTVDDVFGGLAKAQKAHFANGGSFDQVYEPGVVH